MSQSNHTDVVASVKADLERRGVSLVGSCGAFAITKRVAWFLREEGAGLLAKPAGENCAGYATGIVMYPDGSAYDMLADAGGANGPQWDKIDPIDPARYRPAVDPGDQVPAGGGGEQHGDQGDQGDGVDIGALLTQAIGELISGLNEIRDAIAAVDKRLADVQAKGIRANLNLRG